MNNDLFNEFCKSIDRVNCDKINMVDKTFMHAIIGIADESGELTQILKRALYYGENLNDNHIMEEYGDILYYIVMDCMRIAAKCALTPLLVFDAILYKNIAKLEARYPNGFREEDAKGYNRDLEKEKQAMLSTKELESLEYRKDANAQKKTTTGG